MPTDRAAPVRPVPGATAARRGVAVAAGAAQRTGRAYFYWAYAYRRTWRGSVITSVVSPVLFLAAMGLGLGSLVDDSRGAQGVQGLPYLTFVAPGILAATAMQIAAGEATYPVMGAIKWQRTYYAALATPLNVMDVLVGHLLWIATRVLMACAIFLAVMAAFGATATGWAVLALPAALLVGVAFTSTIMAFAATVKNDAGFAALFRFGIVPLFLFSGVFFPVDQLPEPMQWVAWATPLWHGVELTRGLALGQLQPGPGTLHVAYLILMAAGGVVLARRAYLRRLHT